MIRIDDVIDAHLAKHPEGDIPLIQRAYIYSAKQHEGQIRKSGEPYMTHPLTVAKIVAEMGLDIASVCAALLHDTIEDSDTTRVQLTELFGEDVAALVDGVTKLSAVNFTKREERQAESFRKLLVAMAQDIRVLLVKLTDRLHNMQTLEYMKPNSQQRIAQETRDIYAPLSDRLGISWLRADLDDLSFKYLEPEVYRQLAAKVDKTKKLRTQYIERTIQRFEELLDKNKFQAEISGRLKNLYSIHKKMLNKGVEYEDINDAIAFRVICHNVRDCYAILGQVHTQWTPIPGRFKDFIAIPKPNRYQSLHTSVIGQDGERVEVQIRTEEMHHVAEYGIAAHWAYKEGRNPDPSTEGFTWLREMLESHNEVRDSEEFLDSVKVNLFRDEVFVFTPNGDVVSLRRGATALDFAYSVHTEVGNRCVGTRINGVQVPIRTKVRNGDMIEVLTSNSQRPSTAWLDIATTSRARNKIRSYLRAEQRKQSRAAGQDLLEKALRRYGCSYNKIVKTGTLKKVAGELKFGNVDDLLAQVGYGKIEKEDIVDRLLPEEKRKKPPAEVKEGALEKVIRKVKKPDTGIELDGVDNLLVRFARCCSPLPGEKIIGYVSRGRGIVIHRSECSRAKAIDPERQTEVQWSRTAISQRPVKLKIITTNRPGILNALSSVFSKLNININSAHCEETDDHHGTSIFTFQVRDFAQLNEIIRELRQTKDVQNILRLPQ